jgi:ABC-type lipoprotein release transport system permease subunit
MSLLLLMASVLEGEMKGALQNTIRLQSGHIQIRPESYEEGRVSLKWEDLIAEPNQVIEKVKALPQVTAATPRLIASGILSISDESKGVQIIGIEPESEANKPFRAGMLNGEFIKADDREGILIGNILAEKLNLKVGDRVNLLVNTSDGNVDEQLFTVRAFTRPRTPATTKIQSSCHWRNRHSSSQRIMQVRSSSFCRMKDKPNRLPRRCNLRATKS